MREAAERHERTLSDLDYQRRIVDDVVTALDRAKDAAITLGIRWDPNDDDDDSRSEAAIDEVSDADEALAVAQARMILRFGPDHAAVRVLREAKDALSHMWLDAVSHEHERRSEEDTQRRLDAAYPRLSKAVDRFLTLTGSIVGSAPAVDGTSSK